MHKGTMELTDHKKERVMQIFAELWDKKCISIKKWHQVLGELSFMRAAISGADSLFGAMQLGLTHSKKNCVQITPYMHDHLTDFKMLTHSMTQRLTHLTKIVPDYPCVISAVDAAQTGMGGVLFTEGKHPIMWHTTFPDDIQQCMVTTENTAGDLTNSDLEQVGVIAQADVANNLYDLHDQMLSTLNDNTAAVSHNQKVALTSDCAGAYLCRLPVSTNDTTDVVMKSCTSRVK